MLAIYAFYSRPFGNDIRSARTHWALPYVEFLTLAYSSAKAKSFGWKTRLVCDEYGKKLIVDDLGIHFDEVHVTLDNIEKDGRFWAAGKLYAYTKGVGETFEPFIFIDNDAGFHEQPPEHFLTSRYRCQHIHNDKGGMFHDMVKRIVRTMPDQYPYDIYHEADRNIEGPKGGNAGVVICNDEQLWREFTKYTWDLQNGQFFDNMVKNAKGNPYKELNLWNVVVEEILLCQLYRRIRHELPQTVFEFNGLHVPVGTSNPTRYFHLWISKRDIKVLRKIEEYAVNFIDPKVSKTIYAYFKIIDKAVSNAPKLAKAA